jgi:hypothetical protein
VRALATCCMHVHAHAWVGGHPVCVGSTPTPPQMVRGCTERDGGAKVQTLCGLRSTPLCPRNLRNTTRARKPHGQWDLKVQKGGANWQAFNALSNTCENTVTSLSGKPAMPIGEVGNLMTIWPQPCTKCGGPSYLKGECGRCREARWAGEIVAVATVIAKPMDRTLEKFACRLCGKTIPSPGWCAACLPGVRSKRRNSKGGAYGPAHVKRRAQLLAAFVPGTVCDLCNTPMGLDGEKLDLDHTVPHSRGGVGDRLVHAKCNRARGAAQTRRYGAY